MSNEAFFSWMSNMEDLHNANTFAHDRKPLHELLTIVFTTSAIPSNPSTTVIETVLQSFQFVPDLNRCNVVVVFDGYVPCSGPSKFKTMRISTEDANRYRDYQFRAKNVFRRFMQLPEQNDQDFLPSETTCSKTQIGSYKHADVHCECIQSNGLSLHFLTLSARFGFALAVRESLQQ